ncbi:MAG: aldehyde dehydrogenase family protein [Planctomycetota bacterium]
MDPRPAAKPQYDLYLNGAWVPSATGETFETLNPATEQVISRVAAAGERDVDAAVKAARAAFDAGKWTQLSASDRGKALLRIAEGIRKNLDELAFLETIDAGKTIGETKNIEVPLAAELFEYYAGWATKITGETIPVRGNYLAYTLREPIGVCAAIVPWNFPLLMAVWKIAPALAAGNVMIVKPSEFTPLSLLKLAEIVHEAGLPPGVFQVLPGFGPSAGAALVRHPGVDKIAFTGSTATGQTVMREAAATLKRVSLELGGKSPNIVLEDADPEAAARGAIAGIFYNKGEVCAAGSRLFVPEKLHDAVMEKVVERAKKLVPGDPLDPKTRFGAIASKPQLEKVLGYIQTGKAEGAKCVTGGERAKVGDGKGYFVQPTVFDGATNQMRIAREEIFGPVLTAITYKDLDEVIALANDSPYGLAAAVFTRDVKKAHVVARRLKAGTVWVNTYNIYDPALPFGGVKQSGFGRELGSAAIDNYTELKSVCVDLNL